MITDTSDSILQKITELIEEFENGKAGRDNKVETQTSGTVYTPMKVVKRIVYKAIFSYLRKSYSDSSIKKDQDSLDFDSIEKLTKDAKLKEFLANVLENMSILDPSCGSGRFLIATANLILSIYKLIHSNRSDRELKKYILESSIFGVEIDKDAANIARLRLICWYLSKEPKILSDFNINDLDLISVERIQKKIGIRLNIYESDFLTEFKYDKTFDIVLGNPPFIENKKNKDSQYKKQLTKLFRSAYRLFDISILFIEQALNVIKKEGLVAYILPNKFLSADYGVKIRELIIKNAQIEEIADISSLGVFGRKAAYPIILFLRKTYPPQEYNVKIRNCDSISQFTFDDWDNSELININLIKKLPKWVIPLFGNYAVIDKVFSKFKLLSEIYPDLKLFYRPFGFLNWSKNLYNVADKKSSSKDMILLGTGNVGKYHIAFDRKIQIAGTKLNVSYYLFKKDFKEIWREIALEKLVFREIAKELTFVYDPGIFTNVTGLYFLVIPSLNTDQLFCLLTILNSTLMNEIFTSLYGSLHMSGGYMRYNGSFIKNLPLPQELPLSLSRLGKIIQFLSQLRCDLETVLAIPSYFDAIKLDIDKFLKFFKRLADCLVYLLYFQKDFYDGFNELKQVLISGNTLPDIRFNFFVLRFDFDCFKTLEAPELLDFIAQIRAVHDRLYNKKLETEMGSLAKNY